MWKENKKHFNFCKYCGFKISSSTGYEYATKQMTIINQMFKSIPRWTQETINKMSNEGWELVQQSQVGYYPLLTFKRKEFSRT